MKKQVLALSAVLIIVTVFVLGGCSSDMSTSPDQSSAVSHKVATSSGTKEVLIGYTGSKPYSVLQAAGATIKREYKHLPVVFASVPEGNINKLTSNPNISHVVENYTREYSAQVLDWGVDRIDAEVVHASGNKGAGINVCVLDSGADMDHPDLTFAGGYSVLEDPDYWEDQNGHGTHCAGIISADDNNIGVIGVAPDCNLYVVQINKSGPIWQDDIMAGYDWVIGTYYDSDPENDIQIMSMSWGGYYTDALEEAAIQTCYGLGILMFAAAGNEEGDIIYPAKFPEVVAVTAMWVDDTFAYFSNFGPEAELIAPGRLIYSTYKRARYFSLSGTSMACPMVAGVAAVAWAQNPGYTSHQIRQLLRDTAEDIGLIFYQQGYGLVDAENAVLGTTGGNN